MQRYERALRLAIARPAMLVVGSLLVLAGAYGSYRLLGSDLLPEMDEGGFILDYIMPAGSSLAETNQVLTGVEQILRRDAGGREHLAPHRPAARAGGGDRSEHRRHLGEAEAQARAAARTR